MIMKNYTLAIIIPCFNSSESIEGICQEIFEVFQNSLIIDNENMISLNRIILVDDGSDIATNQKLILLNQNPKITVIFLNKNYGQHPAIFAAALNSTEDFLITIDEDGEHNPRDISAMFSLLLKTKLDIVYANFKSSNISFREIMSKIAKALISVVSGDKNIKYFSSFRLVRGEVFRTASIYANNGAFLDVALGWITKKIGVIVTQKRKSKRKSTYNFKSLLAHFGKLFFASGIRPLILLFNFGWVISTLSLVGVIFIIYRRVFNFIPVQGWVSNTVVLMFFGGIIISALGLIARYISSIVETSSGKPYFTIKNKSNG